MRCPDPGLAWLRGSYDLGAGRGLTGVRRAERVARFSRLKTPSRTRTHPPDGPDACQTVRGHGRGDRSADAGRGRCAWSGGPSRRRPRRARDRAGPAHQWLSRRPVRRGASVSGGRRVRARPVRPVRAVATRGEPRRAERARHHASAVQPVPGGPRTAARPVRSERLPERGGRAVSHMDRPLQRGLPSRDVVPGGHRPAAHLRIRGRARRLSRRADLPPEPRASATSSVGRSRASPTATTIRSACCFWTSTASRS